jgi:hypothetical protein
MSLAFCYTGPVKNDQFVDRNEILNSIINYTTGHDLGNIWLQGDFQTGKTSTLYNLPIEPIIDNSTGVNYRFVYFDCQCFLTRKSLLEAIAAKINLELDLGVQTTDVYEDYFTAVFAAVHRTHQYVIIMFDEFDSLFSKISREDLGASMTTMKNIRSALNGIQFLPRQPKLMGAVFSSTKSYEDLTDKFEFIGSKLNYNTLQINWFDHGDIKLLAKTYLAEDLKLLTDDDILNCYRISHGHPMVAQKVLELIYSTRKSGIDIKYSQIAKECRQFIKFYSPILEKAKIPKYVFDRLYNLGIKVKVNLLAASIELESKAS